MSPSEAEDDRKMGAKKTCSDTVSPTPVSHGSGYVVKSLEAALWAFHEAQDYREAVLKAASLGDDADTTGAVFSQLAGACWGESEIPTEWIDGLARRDMIEKALAGLLNRRAPRRTTGADP